MRREQRSGDERSGEEKQEMRRDNGMNKNRVFISKRECSRKRSIAFSTFIDEVHTLVSTYSCFDSVQ